VPELSIFSRSAPSKIRPPKTALLRAVVIRRHFQWNPGFEIDGFLQWKRRGVSAIGQIVFSKSLYIVKSYEKRETK
jgi:hypothetical protein